MSGRIPSGIPDRFTDVGKYFKVIPMLRPAKDGDFNEVIQEQGAQLGVRPSRDLSDHHEMAWYRDNVYNKQDK